MKTDFTKFARFLMKAIADKPKSKWPALTHIWDRAIVVLVGTWIIVTAFMTNQVGILLVIVVLAGMLFFGLYLISIRR